MKVDSKVGGAFGHPGGAIRADYGRMSALGITRAGVPVSGLIKAVGIAGALLTLAHAAGAVSPPRPAESAADGRFATLEHAYVV